MRRKGIFLFLISILVSTGSCSMLPKRDTGSYSDALAEFLPVDIYEYYGDSNYYHVVKTLITEKGINSVTVTLTGEVRDNSNSGASDNKDSFEQCYIVTDNEISLLNNGDLLNESDYDHIKLLKLPLKVGTSWSFKAKRDEYKNIKVNAEITFVDDRHITVNYYDNKGYQETRIITKEKGVTDFYKVYQYKDAMGITGFHIDESIQ